MGGGELDVAKRLSRDGQNSRPLSPGETMNALTALEILRAARDRSYLETVKTEEVRQALRALNPRCADTAFLRWFWDCADSPNEIGRSQNMKAALNGILRQLGLPTE
jgi:hypothetical protein